MRVWNQAVLITPHVLHWDTRPKATDWVDICFFLSVSRFLSRFWSPSSFFSFLTVQTYTHKHKQTQLHACALPKRDDEYPRRMDRIKNNINEKALIAAIYQPVQCWTPSLTDTNQCDSLNCVCDWAVWTFSTLEFMCTQFLCSARNAPKKQQQNPTKTTKKHKFNSIQASSVLFI